MIKKKNNELIGLLINTGYREAGSMEKDGRIIEWEEGEVLTIIPFENEKGQAKKIVIHPSSVKAIYSETESLHWGAFISITLEGKKATSISVLGDVLESFYDIEL